MKQMKIQQKKKQFASFLCPKFNDFCEKTKRMG